MRKVPVPDNLRDPGGLQLHLQEQFRLGKDAFRIALREAVMSFPGGVSEVSRRSGLARTGIYKALGPDGNPSLNTLRKLLDVLGMQTVMGMQQTRDLEGSIVMDLKSKYIVDSDQQYKNSTPGKPAHKQHMESKPRILPGSGKGIFIMSDDFDAPLPEFGDYM
jgi:DNA-binding phage protein